MRESTIQSAALLAVHEAGARVFRNNVGVAYYPTTPRARARVDEMVRQHQLARVKYGLEVGSSDLVGWRTVTIAPDDVGRRVAVFVGVEMKATTGRAARAQRRWLDALRIAGGLAGIARSADEAVRVSEWR